jgi:hypothetical protein
MCHITQGRQGKHTHFSLTFLKATKGLKYKYFGLKAKLTTKMPAKCLKAVTVFLLAVTLLGDVTQIETMC